MNQDEALTADEVAKLLKVSKGTVYAMKDRGDLPSFLVGRKLRFTRKSVLDYMERSQTAQDVAEKPLSSEIPQPDKGRIVICGQDIILDVLSNYMNQAGHHTLRAYVGSYDALSALYKDEVQIASSHLWDGESDTYNVPYVRRLLPGVAAVVVNLTYRTQGFYVAKGNPLGLNGWKDLAQPGIRIVNREKGAGSRILLDEHLRMLDIDPGSLDGYDSEVQSHIAVASAVARGRADVAVGSEKIARQVEGIDFVPLQKERYDLVLKKRDLDTPPMRSLMGILESGLLKEEFSSLGGYDTSDMGKIMWIG
ncbi:helix-turn-helix transcriptional regulator [uncultured Ellagibacter sp.]|uniref:helix-turn-helix transcriptional regulator n=1 Tax=uncultured Ellagibacter sp. TaxID=2137580 RepID=UPI0025F13089|nr:helix-turn-helix transcriptional regulator [uncultured Ellagibacter sp.]